METCIVRNYRKWFFTRSSQTFCEKIRYWYCYPWRKLNQLPKTVSRDSQLWNFNLYLINNWLDNWKTICYMEIVIASLSLARAHPSLARARPSLARAHPSLARAHPSLARAHPSLTRAHPSLARAHPSLAKAHPRPPPFSERSERKPH